MAHPARASLSALMLVALSTAACGAGKGPIATTGGAGPAGGGGADGASSAPAAAVVQNTTADAKTLTCGLQARDVAGNKGTAWYVRCPAGCGGGGAVWGTDVYTDDSSVCVAAVHAGHLDAAAGGIILVTWLQGPPVHVGSARHGITSVDYGAWSRSFYVQSVDDAGRPTSPAPTARPAGTVDVGCTTSAVPLTGEAGARWRVICPAACGDASVWGSDPYTADSSVCHAAAHAGVISAAAGGEATITIDGPHESYAGSARNGVTTTSYGAYERSFHVSR